MEVRNIQGENLQFLFFSLDNEKDQNLSLFPSLLSCLSSSLYSLSSFSRRGPLACHRLSLLAAALSSSSGSRNIIKPAPVGPVPVVERVQQRQLPRELDLPHQVAVVLLRQARPPPGRELARLGEQALQGPGVPEVDERAREPALLGIEEPPAEDEVDAAGASSFGS